MKSLENTLSTKGMVFAGCSFTWGQGLYYYSNLDTLKEPLPDHYDRNLVKHAHIKFKESVRYPRLVANHFNTYEFVHPENGGSNWGAVHWWENCFTNKDPGAWYGGHSIPKIEYSEVSHVVFQLTQWQRDNFNMQLPGDPEKHEIPFHCTHQEQYRDKFFKWLDHQQISLGTWIQNYIQGGLDNVKRFLQDCENNGIKTLLFTWPSEYLMYIEKDPWLKERFVTFDYKGINYKSIEDLMSPGAMHSKGYNPELTIKWDEQAFTETPKDHHPSLTCHRVMADNIIKRIENDRSATQSL
jgi:hypothetical protein